MSELFEYSNHGAVGVITVVNPPVNALSIGVPQGIIDGVAAGEADDDIRALQASVRCHRHLATAAKSR